MSLIIHIAGNDIRVNDLIRQRCAWCGTVLIDYDLARIMVPEGQPDEPGTWPVGELIGVDGGMSYVVNHQDGAQLPAEACARIDPEVTR